MVRQLAHADIEALAHGSALLGSAGGGATTYLELLVQGLPLPVDLHDPDQLDPETPCVAAAFAGSTMVLAERLPGDHAFAPLMDAVDRWTGRPATAICSLEIGGMNGLTALVAADGRTLVDADCMGRALPGIDQLSLAVDRLPGLVFAAATRSGVVVTQTGEPAEAEAIVRSALAEAGGTGPILAGGFTVGDLIEHAVPGAISGALDLGRAALEAAEEPLTEYARALGGRLVASGRIRQVESTEDPQVQCFAIEGDAGEVHRLITRTETLAVTTDGQLVAGAPDVLAVIDARTRAVREVPQLGLLQQVAVIELPIASWWRHDPARLAHVLPSRYGVPRLDRYDTAGSAEDTGSASGAECSHGADRRNDSDHAA
ncbi:DUF917 family protein [Brachybacterium sp. GCM10030267]|uniref:S-methyl thiohydantoin desulfurase domain-containing protein n=1 Tax=unclassified Brachybacterium TaxID=2623841 RepID=UPI0036189004